MNYITGKKAALLGLAAILTASVLSNPTPSSAALGPSLVSVAPNASTGITQTFSLVYSDPNGISDLKTAQVLFNASVSAGSACYVTYSPSTNQMFLYTDAGTSTSAAITPGSSATAANSQCTLNGAGSSFSISGNKLTLNVSLTFSSAFAGTKNIYMYATGNLGTSVGWTKKGTWTRATSSSPSLVSITPSSGSGASQTFSMVYADPNHTTDFKTVRVLFNGSVSSGPSCYITYSPATNQMSLYTDAGTSTSAAITPGSSATASNSQCTLNGAGSSITTSGNNLTLNVALTFSSAFTGTKNSYMYATTNGGTTVGWTQKGTWTLPEVTSVSVSPATAQSITTGTLPFTATVSGTTTNKAVTWTVSAGSITSAGVFTAPATTGTVTVTATSSADHTKSAAATVTVVAETTDALNGELFSHNWNQPKESHVPSVPFTGMRLWNTGTAWSDIETSNGVYSWARLDTWLAIAGEHDKDVLFTIGNTPVWAGGGPGLNNPPSDIDSGDELFKTYVTAVVKHSLASTTGHIKYYETWNEPDITTAWSGSQTQMIKLATDLYTIVHSLDPSAQVVSPPPSTYNAWMLSYFTAGGYVPMDVIGVHGYPGGKYTEPIKIPTLMGHLHDLRTQFNLTHVPVFVTEGSWGNDSTHGVSGLTNDEEIAYVAQMYLFMWNGGMTRFYWYSWDGVQPDGTQGYGQLWTPTGGVKPAGTAYGLLYKWLVGSTTVGTPCSEGTDGTWVCNLTLENKAPARIVWNTNGPTTYSATPFVSYQTLDNETVHLIADGTVTINTKPILLY